MNSFFVMDNFILSSSGLKNIITDENDEFTFVFGEKEVRMNRIFAEFISPVVSHLHRADMTINKIYFEEKKISNIPPFEEIFTNEIIKLLHQLLEGLQVSLKEEQVKKLEIIAILFGNDDFLNTLHDLLPIKYEDDQITDNLMKVEAIECISKNTTLINCDIAKIIEYLSEHFHMIDEKEIKKNTKININ